MCPDAKVRDDLGSAGCPARLVRDGLPVMRCSVRRLLVIVVLAVTALGAALAVPTVASAAGRAPAVSGVDPAVGNVHGGFRVTVHGRGFTHVQHVYFGAVAGRSVHVASTRTLTVTAPAHGQSDVHVRVITAAGKSGPGPGSVFRYRRAPEVTSVSPSHGLVAGGEQITVRGSGLTWVRGVRFGDRKATSVHVVSARLVRATAPRNQAGGTHVRVVTAHGTSRAVAAARYTYWLMPVRDLAVDTTATSATLSWRPPASGDPTEVMIRRRAGTTPPVWPSRGELVTTITDASTHYRDLNRDPDTHYAYAVFALHGTQHSPAAGMPVQTSATSRPSAPTDLQISPAPQHTTAGPCAGASGWLGNAGGQFRLAARVANPDNPDAGVAPKFELADLGGTGTSDPAQLIPPGDPAGPPLTINGTDQLVFQDLDPAMLVDGHKYQVDAYTADATATSAKSATCTFWYDADQPATPDVAASTPTVHVGDTVTFTLTSSDTAPDGTTASGIDHIGYSLASASDLDGDGGTHAHASGSGDTRTATISVTPTLWGTNYLYAQAVDRAGNTSPTATYAFYVSG